MSGPVHDAVMLMAFGAPEAERDVAAFLGNVTRGRPLPASRLREVEAHYRAVGGGSPLNALTARQARALKTALQRQGVSIPVTVGMRYWPPFIRDTLAGLAEAGARRVMGLIMAPFESDASRGAYRRAVEQARAELGQRAPAIAYAPPLVESRGFAAASQAHIAEAMQELGEVELEHTTLLFTAHSVPDHGADGFGYANQFERCAAQIARAVGHPRYAVAYQSRSGAPAERWLEPEVRAVIRVEAERGTRCLVVSPVGFACDNLEVLYDLDIEARQAATAAGLQFRRASAVNDHPAFIEGLVGLVLDG